MKLCLLNSNKKIKTMREKSQNIRKLFLSEKYCNTKLRLDFLFKNIIITHYNICRY